MLQHYVHVRTCVCVCVCVCAAQVQKHAGELESASLVCLDANLPHQCIQYVSQFCWERKIPSEWPCKLIKIIHSVIVPYTHTFVQCGMNQLV